MHPSGVCSVAFFPGTIFAWGTQFLLRSTKASFSTDFALTFWGEDQKRKQVFIANAPEWRRFSCFLLGRNFRLLVGHIFCLRGGTNSKLGAQPRNDPRSAGPAWMFLLEIYCIEFVV